MKLGRGVIAGGNRQVRVGERNHRDHVHEGLPQHLRRGPRLIMCAGLVILAVLGLTSGVFAVVGLLIILFGASLMKRRRLAADRHRALQLAERQAHEAWRRSLVENMADHSRRSRSRAAQDPTGILQAHDVPPTITGGPLPSASRVTGREDIDTAPAHHSDAA